MLKSIHFLLTYMCNYECDHCFLYCGPDSQGTFTIAQVRRALDEIRKIKTVESICFEGGEPFLFFPLMRESIRIANSMGFKTAVETNSYWATSVEDAELWLKQLIEVGLSNIEVSDDSYHHDEEIDNPAKKAISAAKVIGMEVNSISIDEPLTEKSDRGDEDKGKPIYVGSPKLRGRAVDKLLEGLPGKSWETFTECPLEDLKNPERVHIDSYGNVHLCQGLSMGNMWETPLSVLIKNYRAEDHPICGPLCEGGPALLAKKYNVPHKEKYVDACHFCSVICKYLIDKFPQFLAPRQVYGLKEKT
jgi:organic radical activating enzyme